MSNFTWIPIYKELSVKLLEYEIRQNELIDIIRNISATGIPMIPLQDKPSEKDTAELDEIDPFTFYSSFNRGITNENRKLILIELKKLFKLNSEVPADFDGIPVMTNQKSWLFAYKYERGKNDVKLLWQLFREAVTTDIKEDTFNEVLNIKGVKINITIGLFWIMPDKYLSLDSVMKEYSGEDFDKLDYRKYYEVMNVIKQKFTGKSFEEISFDAWKIKQGKSDISYYIIGSKYGGSEDVFQEMLKENVISTGFAREYDLKDYVGKLEEDIVEYLSEKAEPSRSYNCLKKFLNISPGDRIAVKADGSPKGNKPFLSVVGIAEVIQDENYYSYEPEGLGHVIKVRWIKAPVYKEFELGGYGQTIHKLSNDEHIKMIFDADFKIDDSIIKSNPGVTKMNNSALNTIIYGPPGTGKTYNTIDKAISIIDGINSETELKAKYGSRELLKKRFDELLISDWDNPKGQIGFITFHQSMSYEDFIEGIKPNTDGSENRIYYNISPGIFKNISYIAAKNYVDSFKPSDVLKKEKTAEQVMADFADSVAEEIAFNGKYRLNDKVFIMEVEVDAFRYSGENWERHAAGIRMKFSDIVEFYKNDIKERIQIKDLENISQLAKQHATYYKIMYDRMKEFEKISKPVLNNSVSENLKSYVLVIDEINRGNVSQIFGELITLIEDDKRAGKTEALEVTLPYSKEKFTVPPNLYIIGTMNTADRSVEALDTALRRRFSFEFMPPLYDLPELDREIAGIKLSSLLKTINERITYLLDEDHQIGHSYFMSIEDEDGLCHVFRNKIIPLLKEYFYNDYGRIRLILGDEFVKLIPENVKPKFAVSDVDWPEREQYRIMIDDPGFNIITALKQTIADNS